MEEEYILEIERLYDEWMQQKENRGISYGEIAYIQNLEEDELNDLEEELLKEIR